MTTGTGRIKGLDGLRAISLLLVVQAHWDPLPGFNTIFEWGRSGLLVFFVLSSFLITRILVGLHDQSRSPGKIIQALQLFYARRFFRIQPVYYFALAFVVIAGLNASVSQDLIYHVLFINNISNVLLRSDIGVYGPAAPWWSLAVEEQFYVFWAPIILFTGLRSWKIGLAAAFVAALAWRLYAWKAGLLQAGFLITLGNLDSLAAGAVVAIVVSLGMAGKRADLVAKTTLFAGGLLAAFLLVEEISIGQTLYRSTLYGKVLGDISIYLIAAPLIYYLATDRARFTLSLLESRPFVFIGKRSYAAYVFYQVVAYRMYYYFPGRFMSRVLRKFGMQVTMGFHGTVEFFVFASVTIALASLSYRYFEMPILRYRDRITNSRNAFER